MWRLHDKHQVALIVFRTEGARTALTAEGAGKIRTGDMTVFLKPVAVAPAVVRRDGRIQAGGHPADHARLGVAEDRLDVLTGTPGIIDEIARSVIHRTRFKSIRLGSAGAR